ncbi:MAG TPA: FHA domain-containing protein [Jatrophihabitans sp.]|jgi:hypothetical protein|uniref:FHA domain-containing protein n=1 Tax=Jatrophihabitans sp. TaxID=1932789 RepID=UPI002DFDC677|nr:FHA domain-containing protein [Jatrophihabitans sp.]
MTEPQGRAPVSVSYVPGRWVALVADDLWLLADLDAGGAVLTACWEAVERRAGVDGLLGVILREGLRSVPSFALAGRTATGYRLLVSGKAQAEATAPGASEPDVVSAAGAPTWIEQHLDGAPELRLVALDDGAAAGGAALPLVGGIVPASLVLIGAVAQTPAAQVPAAPLMNDPGPPIGAPPAPAPAPAAPPMPAAPPAPFVPAPAPGPPSTDTLTPRPDDDRVLIDSLPWRSPESYAPADGEPPLREPVVPPPVEEPPTRAFEAPRFDTPDLGRPTFDQPLPPAAPPTDQFWMPPQPLAPPPASAAGNQPISDAVQYTVERSAMAPTGPAAPLVHAVTCPLRHLNPPYAGSCRVCGQPVASQNPFTAPRPSLGVLMLSTGDTVPLDRDVVLGRAPFHVDSNARSRPHLVQLTSPGNDISRSHVRVSLEGWHVQVVDLGSTNGTVVTLPGQSPVRLRAHDPFTIVAGTVIDIADEVEVRFEVPA